MSDDKTIRIRYVPNRFRPDTQASQLVPYPGGPVRLADMCRADGLPEYEFIVSGMPVPDGDLGYTYLHANDEVVITERVADPATVAAITTAISAAMTATVEFVAAHWLAVTMTAISLVGSAVTIFQTRKAFDTDGGGILDNSPTYGWDGVQTMADEDVPIPIVYGKNHVGGNIINAYVDNEGDDQVISVLLALGHGPFKSIAGVESDTDAIRSRVTLFAEADTHSYYERGISGVWVKFPAKDCTGLLKASGQLTIDMKADYPARLKAAGQLEITSSGNHDTQEWAQPNPASVASITDEWQTFTWDLADMDVTGGGLDVTKINYIRWYNYCDGGPAGLHLRNARITFSSSNVASIGSKILVDGNPISNYENITLNVRMGSDDQTAVPGFKDIHRYNSTRAENVVLEQNDAYTYTTKNSDVEKVVIFFEWPSGLYKVDRKGSFYPWWGEFEIAYREHDPTDTAAWGTAYNFRVETKTNATIRRKFEIPVELNSARYDIKVTKTSEDPSEAERDTRVGTVKITAFDEVLFREFTYPGVALLGVRALATNQLSGTLPQLEVEVEGLKCTDWNGTQAYSRNPVVCVYDCMTNAVYGLGDQNILSSSFTATQLDEMETYCDASVDKISDPDDTEARFCMDVVLDSEGPALDVINQIATSFQGIVFYVGGKINVVIDKPESVSQIFSVASIRNFEESFLSHKQKYNEVSVQFANEDNQYKRESISLESSTARAAGDARNRLSTTGIGITRMGHAGRYGWFLLNKSRLCSRVVRFEAPMTGILCNAGDVVGIAHNIPAWGVSSGKVLSATQRGGA